MIHSKMTAALPVMTLALTSLAMAGSDRQPRRNPRHKQTSESMLLAESLMVCCP